ncbi:uroporphyrinogen-III synthase [Paenibacillus sp. R14(2021)]|uniref:uroporphyrinogen-III synthase n=1 Tax=Paenibacillus sp. R14(2021) TaxID=2859228 RepID=UPI001C6162C6|nr:uroporphyrinogen-III synthase [Paenibacillus sp. R14(2021)]
MAKNLLGKRIAITGSRKLPELSEIIERQGGTTIVRPQQGLLVLREEEVEKDLLHLLESGTDWCIFTTGTGLAALLQQADRLGIRERLLEIIRESKVGARGYKTYAMLKQLGISPLVLDEDGTTEGLVKALRAFDFKNQGIFIQLHGEEMPALTDFFEAQGAAVRTLLPYKHTAPDAETSLRLCREIIDGEVDAVCFTTAVQVRYLYDFARQHGCAAALNDSFSSKVHAAAVGRVTADVLLQEGVERVSSPAIERMGAMIVELARCFEG